MTRPRTCGTALARHPGLVLIVSVVALGVVSARAVVERRQQIGVLRAIGVQPGMVRLALLT
jgi:putative ABC transport system permease protein